MLQFPTRCQRGLYDNILMSWQQALPELWKTQIILQIYWPHAMEEGVSENSASEETKNSDDADE